MCHLYLLLNLFFDPEISQYSAVSGVLRMLLFLIQKQTTYVFIQWC